VSAYYNDVSKHACEWQRRLCAEGWIAPGRVDERSIEEITPEDLHGYQQFHAFAGIGGWSLALRLAGVPDHSKFWTASLPCQPFSVAGKQRETADDRHLWPAYFTLVQRARPVRIVGEQVAGPAGLRWLDCVFDDLEDIGYTCGAAILPACSVGAWHRRERILWVADAFGHQQPRKEPRSWPIGRVGGQLEPVPWNAPWPGALSRLRTLDDGFPRCVAGTDAARNAIVPRLAAQFIAAYLEAREAVAEAA
jgi:DNA (cytosine-5)-methyltransferase 1